MEAEKMMRTFTEKLGWFHEVFLSIISIAYIFQSIFNFAYVFTTMRADHRCFVPECETPDALELDPPWLRYAVPLGASGPSSCSRYLPLPATSPGEGCSPHSFSNMSVLCEQRVYANKHLSIMTEWDMACSLTNHWMLAMAGTANSIGRALGLPGAGFVSDALGRRSALLAGLGISCVIGLTKSLSTSYAMFVTLEFLDPIFFDSIGGTAFILGMELVPTRWRGAWTAMSHVVFGFGVTLLGAVAWALPYWRWMLRVVYGAAVLAMAALWFIPESVRWLLAKQRTEDAYRVVNLAARMNGIPPSHRDKPSLQKESLDEDPEVLKSSSTSVFAEMKEFVKSRVMMLRLMASCLGWVAAMFVYDGMSIYSVSLAGNRYLNFVLVALIEVPAAVLAWQCMVLVGRRWTLAGSLVLASACCISYHFLPAEDPWPRTSAVLLGKLFITIGYTVTYVMSAELFPTRLRQTLYFACATCGRLGTALAPQMPLLTPIMDTLPLIVFGCVSFAAALLTLILPETSNVSLPDSVKEAEAIGSQQQQQQPASQSAAATGHT